MFGMTFSPSMLAAANTIQRLPKDRSFICFDTFGGRPNSWIEVVQHHGWFGYNPRGEVEVGAPDGRDLQVKLYLDELTTVLGRRVSPSYSERFDTALLLSRDSMLVMSKVYLTQIGVTDDHYRAVLHFRISWESATTRGFAR